MKGDGERSHDDGGVKIGSGVNIGGGSLSKITVDDLLLFFTSPIR